MISTPDLTELLRERIPAATLGALLRAAALATERRLPLYLVGGVVRDLLLGRPHVDVDLTVVGDAAELAAVLAGQLGGRVLLHRQFGTARVTWDDLGLDLAMARAEHYPRPGVLPVVRPGDLRDDLLRRDFTINALAVRLDGSHWGQLIDLAGGLDDLQRGLVRILHPGSFQDDPTRLLRAVRYEQRLGFRLEPGTEALLRRDLGFLAAVSADRRRRELDLILQEDRPEPALQRAQELGLLGTLLPGLRLTQAAAAAFAAARAALAPEQPSPGLYLCLMVYELAPEERAALAGRLRLPADQAKALTDLSRVQSALAVLDAPETSPSAVVSFLDGCADLALLAAASRIPSLRVQRRIACYRQEWRGIRPLLTGRDLQDLGVPRGPLIGTLLARLRAARLDGLTQARAAEVELVRKWLADLAGSAHRNRPGFA